jgi:signal transduction histidine kinase/ActR/RegA family two-component response regulator
VAYLRVYDGTGRRFALEDRATIGRGTANTIRVTDPYVSRRHAAIELTQDGELRLVDLDSRHGTFWRGQRVDSVLLAHGDEILIGGTRLRVYRALPRCTEQDADFVAPTGPGGPPDLVGATQETGPFARADEIADPSKLQESYELLWLAYEVLSGASPEPRPEPLLRRILAKVLTLFAARRGLVMLLDPVRLTPDLTVSLDQSDAESPQPLRLTTPAVAEVMATGRGRLCAAGCAEMATVPAEGAAPEVGSAMVAPIVGHAQLGGKPGDEKRTIGLVYLEDGGLQTEFDDADVERLEAVAGEVGRIVERHRRQDALGAAAERERERLDEILGALPFGLLHLDSQHRPVFTNRLADAWLPRLGSLGTGGVLTHIGEITLETVLLATSDGRELELTLTGPPRRVLAVSRVPTGDPQAPEHLDHLIVLRDITEHRRLARRRTRREHLAVMGDLAGTIARDFNDLLSVILSYAVLVAEDPTSDDARDDLEQLKRTVRTASDLARRLLAFSGRDLLRREPVDVNAVVIEVERLLARLLSTRVVVETQLAEDLRLVAVDSFALERALTNLVLNAKDAMPEGGQLTVRTANLRLERPAESLIGPMVPGEWVSLEVIDTGAGMTERELWRTFEPFYTTKESGSGLGLATVYGLVKQSGGHIQADSAPGQGTRVQILLPAAGPQAQPSTDTAEPARTRPALGAGRLVLLAEDDPAVQTIARRVLVRAGFRVLTASDGEEALTLADENLEAIDLLVTDVVMPGLSGADLANALTERRPDLRVLIMSGYVGNALQSEDIDAGRTAFLAKPFGPRELLEEITRLFDADRS